MAQVEDGERSLAGCRPHLPRKGLASALRLIVSTGIVLVAWMLLDGSTAAAAESEDPGPADFALIRVDHPADGLTIDSDRLLGLIGDSELGDSVSRTADEIAETVPQVLEPVNAVSARAVGDVPQLARTAMNLPILRTATGGGPEADKPDQPTGVADTDAAGADAYPLSPGAAYRLLGQHASGTSGHGAAASSGQGTGRVPANDRPGPLMPMAVTSTGIHSADSPGGAGSGGAAAVIAAGIFLAALLTMLGVVPSRVPPISRLGKKPSVSPD